MPEPSLPWTALRGLERAGEVESWVAVVTGAGGMMGSSIAQRFAQFGARVVFNDRRDEAAESEAADARRRGHEAIAVAADVSTRDGARRAVDAALTKWGQLDALVNVAGGMKGPIMNPVWEITEEQWHRTISVNLDTAFHCTQAALDAMIPRRVGKLVNIASTSWAGSPAHAHYAAAKAALVSFTRSVALQVAEYDINVNVIAPGMTVTRAAERSDFPDPEEFKKTIPLGRPNDPSDIADAALFLVSGAARNISGQIITIAGGSNPSL